MAGGPGHAHLHQFGRALTVTDHLQGKIVHDAVQRRLKSFGDGALHLGRGGLAGGGEEERVGGGRVTVDGDRVEGGIDVARQHLLQRGGGYFCVSEQVDQHRRHIRRDHAGAFGDARDVDHPTIALHDGLRTFGEGVGGHHRVGGHFNRIVAQSKTEIGDFCGDPVMRQRFANDTGGGREDAAGGDLQRIGNGTGHGGDSFIPDTPGEGVGVAGVDDDRRSGPGGNLHSQFRLAIPHASRAGGGAGENPRQRGTGGKAHQHHILAVLVAYARFHRGEFDPGDDRQLWKADGGER